MDAVPGSIRGELARASARLATASREPARDAALLLGHVLGSNRAWLLAHPDTSLTAEQLQRFDALVGRRALHEPMQYILGEQEFYGLALQVNPSVLIPRPETEHLVEAVLAQLPPDTPAKLIDVGTGSGAIAIALAFRLPLATIDALDLSHEALAVAEENARRHGVDARIRFHHSDLLTALAGHSLVDVVVANPPYVPASEQLEPQVANWEPHSALFAGPEGLDVYTRLLPQAAAALKPGGLLALELGAGQQSALTRLFATDARWSVPSFLNDLQGLPRVATARWLPR